ncbi:MAG: hypothetical protein V3T23_02470 [Nitrososphaerales archaeon]
MKRKKKRKVVYYIWRRVDCLTSMQTRLKKKSDQFAEEHKGHRAWMRRATGPERIYEAA